MSYKITRDVDRIRFEQDELVFFIHRNLSVFTISGTTLKLPLDAQQKVSQIDFSEIDAAILQGTTTWEEFLDLFAGPPVFETPLREDEDPSNVTYRGYALIGADESASVWAISKTDVQPGQETAAKWANGNALFINKWDDRKTSITYS